MTALLHRLGRPERQAYLLLRTAFVVAPILFGLDKFFDVMVEWPDYLAGWVNDIVPGSGQQLMYVVGVVEILAGVLVAVAPRIGAYVVAAWLAGIVINLLTIDPTTHYDVALRDVGLLLAALALARLAASDARRVPDAEVRTPGVPPARELVNS
jgi:uncharacterized membrane protein YphA (DoxX/SURF4 family)